MILHIPHASTNIPSDIVFNKTDISDDLERMTDWYTDDLFRHPNSDRVVAPISRLVCDMERLAENEPMEYRGMGICYTNDSYGNKLRDIDSNERQRIINDYYVPHHSNLTSTVSRTLSLFDHAIIVDCHSFYPEKLPHEDSSARPDFCLGVDDYHTPPELVESLVKNITDSGYTVEINEPFSGTIVPLAYYNTNPDVWSIMIEVNRGLYLDGTEPSAGYEKTKEMVTKLLNTVDSFEDK